MKSDDLWLDEEFMAFTNELTTDVPEHGIYDWLDELKFYIQETHKNHSFFNVDMTMMCLDSVYSLMNDLNPESTDYLAADATLDEILPFWLPFWISTWQDQSNIYDAAVVQIKRGAVVH